jgi:DNA polymerase-3 subunit alpha
MGGIGSAFDIKVIVTTDAHYLKKEDRWVHKAFLNSKNGEREVDTFYEYAYLQSTDEIIGNLRGTNLDYNELETNTLEIYNKIEDYSLAHNQHVLEIDVPHYRRGHRSGDKEKYPVLTELLWSTNEQERYWVNYCLSTLEEKNLLNDEYLSRLEYEADIKKHIGEKLNTCVFAYPNFLQHYINLFWECGSPVGAGRGSAGAGLNHYLLGITQTDPLKTNAPFWRYMNKDRAEMPDIDLDLAPSRRETIFNEIRKERGDLGCIQVCTFGTATTKSAVQIACRGYTSEEFKDGIDNDTALYISSLIPSERGFLWPIKDVINGNKEKDRKPNKIFLNAVNQYPGLLDIIIGIEGLIVSRGIHASGVVFYDDDPYKSACFMKATSGAIITQYSLHDAEYCGDVKYDFLVTEQMDIVAQCIQLLQENGYMDKNLSLRQAYDKYVHPDKLPLEDEKLWDVIDSTNVLALFQLNTAVGGNVVRQLLPRTVEELTACNALMRLTGEKGAERPADRYARLKNDISQWYQEMDNYGLTKDEQFVLEKYMLTDYGAPSSQEVLMTILMDPDTCGFTLAESNAARKIVAKKQMDKISELRDKIISKAKRPVLGQYIWTYVIMPQASYSFSRIHGYSYSLIACQAAYLSSYFPSIYWNTAYLRVISGLDADASSNYNKIARGVGDIISHGVNVSLIDINKSGYMFEPDEENNAIRFGLKALNGVGGEIIEEIIAQRPYEDMYEFIEKVKCNKTVMIALIKSGAFDQFDSRENIMKEYLWITCSPKKRVTMQNFNMLNERGLLPRELDFQKRVFIFNKALKKNCKVSNGYLSISDNYYEFYSEFFDTDLLHPKGNLLCITENEWKKIYDKSMAPAKQYITSNREILLEKLNDSLFQEDWDKYAAGTLSTWEMASLGFYYHEHELAHINDSQYGIVEYNNLPEQPIVDYTFKRNGREIPIFKTFRLCGTVIAKDDLKSSISILTKGSGVVTVKMTRDYYARYNAQLSEMGIDGKKHVMEKGWFKRGTLVVVNGYRRQNQFVTKAYKKTGSHQLYKIIQLNNDGTINMTNHRWGEEDD